MMAELSSLGEDADSPQVANPAGVLFQYSNDESSGLPVVMA